MTRHHIIVLFNRMHDLLCDNVSKIQNLIVRGLNEIRPGRSKPRAFKKKVGENLAPRTSRSLKSTTLTGKWFVKIAIQLTLTVRRK